ncbi:uncharacterized protein B4U80_13880 [Leptotrombidium deliense]|uniref:Calcineurin-like phosphoesterase domain-containing protein n=1 Tax=Leptotrombidium deliense TaxID=299467 RepID=A0A443SA19_9ACAR|nr:uncharacterized protein B4U80_13880 [Leptotrombidium deliense]
MPSRFLKTRAVYVFGDIHGNIADLLTYERNIWKTAPGVTPCDYLFLDDYVDRGEYGVKVILAPNKQL